MHPTLPQAARLGDEPRRVQGPYGHADARSKFSARSRGNISSSLNPAGYNKSAGAKLRAVPESRGMRASLTIYIVEADRPTVT